MRLLRSAGLPVRNANTREMSRGSAVIVIPLDGSGLSLDLGASGISSLARRYSGQSGRAPFPRSAPGRDISPKMSVRVGRYGVGSRVSSIRREAAKFCRLDLNIPVDSLP